MTDAPPILMRVTFRRRKDEIGTCTGSGHMTNERLEWHLWNWRMWMRSGKGVEGYPMAAIGLRSIGQSDFNDMAQASDRRCAIACNAVVEGLPTIQTIALYKQYRIGYAVYRFPRGNFEDCLEAARESVKAGLERKGLW